MTQIEIKYVHRVELQKMRSLYASALRTYIYMGNEGGYVLSRNIFKMLYILMESSIS